MNKIIKKILMCEPSHFEVSYKINPWMQIGSVNKKLAGKQWQDLVKIYEDLKIEVEIVEQKKGLPDMVFTADQGIIKGQNLLLSNFRYEQRQKETDTYSKWFEEKGYLVNRLPENVSFEGGGESLWFGNKLLVGTGFRGRPEISRNIKEIWPEVEIISLQLIDPYFYHLDTCLFVLNRETIFYYPSAFSDLSQIVLKQITPNLIEISKKEACNFAANSTVTDHHVVMQKGNLEFLGELGRLGYVGVETDVSEFMKAGGGIHCLTSILAEE